MINTRFELYKLRRTLMRNGIDVTFYRKPKNEYGEPSGVGFKICTVRCLYHESNSFKTFATADGSTTVTEKKPMLLCAVDDLKNNNIEAGDYTVLDDAVYGGKKALRFVGVDDIQNFGIIADISLEVVEDGFES